MPNLSKWPVRLVVLALAEGVDLDQPYAYDTKGWTPLQHAIDARQVDCVRVLMPRSWNCW